MDYLLRNEAPLTPQQWARLDSIVVDTARQALVGRRFIPLLGPFGPGVQALPDDEVDGAGMGVVDRTGDLSVEAVRMVRRNYLPLPITFKDFRIHWRDIETSRQQGVPLDFAAAAIAAGACARAEDDMIFNGCPDMGYHGLLTDPARNRLPMRDWRESGHAFGDVVAATQTLVERGFFGPYALIVSPRLYAILHRVLGNTGVLEIEQIQKLTRAGVFQTSIVPEPTALVISTGAENMDLAVGQDLTTAYLGPENMNHLFRVFEIVALRIRRPGAICQLGGVSESVTG